MSLDLHSLAWHRSVGKLIMQLNRPEFWSSLIRVLNEYVQIDNWVVLVFGDHAVRVISLPEVADSEEIDAFSGASAASVEDEADNQPLADTTTGASEDAAEPSTDTDATSGASQH